jgi:hypothetical protein
MTILSSVIRTFFIDIPLDTFFGKLNRTISSGLHRLESTNAFDPRDLKVGMFIRKIQEIPMPVFFGEDGYYYGTYYNCRIVDFDLEEEWFDFHYDYAELADSNKGKIFRENQSEYPFCASFNEYEIFP